MNSRLKALSIALITLTLNHTAFADQQIIQETESLYNSLPVNDASRPALALRLADQVFNETLVLQKASGNTPEETSKITEYRKKAIRIYKSSLAGLDGAFAKPTGELKWKIEFQMARLLADDGSPQEANRLWREIVEQKENPTLRREAALRLAEALETEGSDKSIKESEKNYDLALQLCENGDVCSYIHYKKAWIFHKTNQPASAIAEMKLALFDSKNQVREESLRDYILFLASRPTDGKQDLVAIQELETQLHRPLKLSQELSDSYFAQGNQKAGVFVLEQINGQAPNLRNYARLLEEFYGFRQWDKFRTQLGEARAYLLKTQHTGYLVKDNPEVEKIIRRLTVQLDGERMSQKNLSEDFKEMAMFYLSAFPQSTERPKMIDGWLAAETDVSKKLAQLKIWGTEEQALAHTDQEIRLREMRAAMAQKTGALPIVIEEMAYLKGNAKDEAHRREFAYQEADAYYHEKDFAHALPIFTEIAKPVSDPTAANAASAPDQWAIQSQNLALDILASQKNYDGVNQQANTWLLSPTVLAWATHSADGKKEIQDMKHIATAAQFERAAAAGKSPDALNVFLELCLAHEFLPKSCDNAKILAVQLKDSDKLIIVLKAQNETSLLASEYETIGDFSRAAELNEKELKPKSEIRQYLRVALLYELGGQNNNRDRILRSMITRLQGVKTLGEEEGLVFETLQDANLLNAAAFKLPWSTTRKLHFADALETAGAGTKETKKLVTGSCEYAGPAWVKYANQDLADLDKTQRSIAFEGAQGQRKFKQRLAALQKLETQGQCYLKESPAFVRIPVIGRMIDAYANLSEQILKTPIPDDVTGEALDQVKGALQKMANPFQQKSAAYQTLEDEQLGKITNAEEKQALETRVVKEHEFAIQDISPRAVASAKETAAPVDDSTAAITQARAELHQNPDRVEPIEKLKNYYGSVGQKRLAAYFEGRLIQSKKEAQ